MIATKPSLFLFLLVATLLPLHPIVATEEDTAPSPAAAGLSNSIDYIRTSCNATLYPEVCFTSLSRYASAVQQSPKRLAGFAIGVSLSRARNFAAYVSNLSRQADYSSDPRAVSALHDCFSNFGDAVDEINDSLKQMRQLGGAGSSGEAFRFQMSNVQTWMSAALTDEETCTDGFEDVTEGPLKTEVCKRATNVKKFTSNALALVNSYVDNGRP